MLQQLRDQTQGTGFKILVGALIAVLTLFGFGATALFSGGDPEIARVGDFEITQNMLSTETERERIRVLSQMGPDADPSTIDRLELQQYALNRWISRQILTAASQRVGVQVSEGRVNQELIGSPAYQVDGKFNEAVYRQSVQSLGYRPVDFVAVVAEDLSRAQLRDALVNTSTVAQWELGELVRVINQRRDIAFLPLTVENFSRDIEVTEEEIEVRYNEDQSLHMTETAVDVAYIRLSVDELLDNASIEVDEDDLLSMYEDDRAAVLRDEQRDSSHILIQVNERRDESAARTLITEVVTRLNAGEDFAVLAGELSEDPGSAPVGGSLGAVGKGIHPPTFEQALWALPEIGAVSAPVQTEDGFHLIRLDAIVEAQYPPFEERRAGIELRVRKAKAQELFDQQALELERVAYEERYSLEGSAKQSGLTVIKQSRISRDATGEDSTLGNAAVLDTLFSEEVLEGSNSSAIELDAETVVFVRVDQQYPPEPIPLEQVSDQIRALIINEQARVKIAHATETGLTQLLAGESVRDIAKSFGATWQTYAQANRIGASDVPADILTYAFSLPRPPQGEKSVGSIDQAGGAALVTVTKVVPGDINTTADKDVAQLRRAVAGRNANVDFESFFVAAEEAIGVYRPDGS